jgi:hypothetical protein
MPKTFSSETISLSVRFPTKLMAWAKAGAEKNGESINEFVRRGLDDMRCLFGLPQVMVDAMDADAKALGLDRREYLMHLVAVRYQEVLAKGPGFERGGQKAKR